MSSKYATFFKEGERAARNATAPDSTGRTPQGPYLIPAFGIGKHWQAKAFADGFRAQCAALGREIK